MKAFLPAVAALTFAGLANAQAVPPEIQVGKYNISDYEFDWGRDGVYCPSCNYGDYFKGGGNNRFAFVDPADNKVYVGHINPDNGFFYPPDGHGWVVDTNAVTAGAIGNGPEWVISARGSELTYTRYTDGKPLYEPYMTVGYATMSNSGWLGASLPDTRGQILPIGSMTMTDPAPLLSWQNYQPSDTNIYWQIEQKGTSPHMIPLGNAKASVTRRWVPGTTKMLMTYYDAAGYRQVFLYDTKTSSAQQLTFDATQKLWAFMWQAPEYPGEFLFFAQVGQSEIDIYRHDPKGASTWHVINKIYMPTATPYVASPEPFVHNGKSWLMFQLNPNSSPRDYTTTSQVAIVGINAGEQVKVLTNDETNKLVRRDPEYYITNKGPFIYYNVYKVNPVVPPPGDPLPPSPIGVFRVDTGLGAPVAPTAKAAAMH